MRLEELVTVTTTLRLEGTLDGVAARRVEALLDRAEPGARFHVDVTQVREFHDFGVAVLGRALARTRASVTLAGLRRHQISVLRYFGIETGPLERAVLSGGG